MGRRLLIVGGSYAATELASQARASGYSDEILMVSEEVDEPYQRPPLSKSFLKNLDERVVPLRPSTFYRDKRIEVELQTRVVSIDPWANEATLSNNTRVRFDTVALATGASPRRVPGWNSGLDNVYYVRTAEDARRLREAAKQAENAVIIGAGFIGLEVASALATLGKTVTVIEAADRVLARAVSPHLSQILTASHSRHGVNILTARKVEPLIENGKSIRKIKVDCGAVLKADIVIVGVGSIPNLDLAQQLRLEGTNGITVDACSRTSRSNVFAAGDCTTFPTLFNPHGVRLESVQNATDQARVAGSVIAGVDKVYNTIPWFWSDQYDQKVQIAGLSFGATDTVCSLDDGLGLSVFHFLNDRCICVESVNRPRDHIAARRVLASDKSFTKRQLLDAELRIGEIKETAA